MSRQADVVNITVRAAAALANRTPETIRRWIWSGRLPAVRDGNRLLVARDDVRQLARGEAIDLMAPLSLRAWADEVAALRLDRQHSGDRRSSRRGITARDLVIEDRRERGADAGR